MAKTIIAPIVGFIFLIIDLTFGIKVDDGIVGQVVETLVTLVSLAVVLRGIFKNHFDTKKTP